MNPLIQHFQQNLVNELSRITEVLKSKIKGNPKEIISKSGLFDKQYYLLSNPDVQALGIDPIDHYLKYGANEGKNPNRFFDSSYYLRENPNVAIAKINPLFHYITYGAKEGKVACSLEKLTLELEKIIANQSIFDFVEWCKPEFLEFFSLVKTQKIAIYCSSIGNYFIAEIADVIAAGFEKIGIKSFRLSEKDVSSNQPIAKGVDHNIIVGPHEFFYLGKGRDLANHPQLAKAIMVNLEQPQTLWFAKSFHYLKQARLIFDINLQSVAFLQELNLPAYFLPLGYLSGYKPFELCSHLPELLALKSLPLDIRNNVPDLNTSLASRPIDLLFVGTLNQRREQFFAENARWLSKFKCFLHIPPIKSPLIQSQGNALNTEAVIGLSQRSKILLNIHRDALPYFEWHRLVFHGLWQKTLVVTEPCHPIPWLNSGEHYIESELKDFEKTLEFLLNTKEGREKAERIRQAGHQALIDNYQLEKILQNSLQLIANSF